LRDKNNVEKYFGNDELWEKSEMALREILVESGAKFYEAEGEAAFYGPKIDVQVKSVLGHDVTLSTVQLDYQLPERFELEYTDENNQKIRPVVIHRAILGSLDRFTAFLIEECAGAFPLWLAPVQIDVMNINDECLPYAKQVVEKLRSYDFRVNLDDRNEKIGKKIREAQLQKIPYMLIVGEKEVQSNSVGVRHRTRGDLGALNLDSFIKDLIEERKEKRF